LTGGGSYATILSVGDGGDSARGCSRRTAAIKPKGVLEKLGSMIDIFLTGCIILAGCAFIAAFAVLLIDPEQLRNEL
jgi:hypothetical protein